MNIIAKTAPEINTQNLDQSLQDFRNYMVDTLELIDFTLSNQKNRIIGAVSADNFNELKNAVSALASQVVAQGSSISIINTTIAGINSALAAIEGELDYLDDSMSDALTAISAAQDDISALEQNYASLDARVTALEQGGTNGNSI